MEGSPWTVRVTVVSLLAESRTVGFSQKIRRACHMLLFHVEERCNMGFHSALHIVGAQDLFVEANQVPKSLSHAVTI